MSYPSEQINEKRKIIREALAQPLDKLLGRDIAKQVKALCGEVEDLFSKLEELGDAAKKQIALLKEELDQKIAAILEIIIPAIRELGQNLQKKTEVMLHHDRQRFANLAAIKQLAPGLAI